MNLFSSDKAISRFAHEYPSNHVLFREGDSGNTLYIIRDGEVKISLSTPRSEVVLAVLGPGDYFGEMSLFMESPRTATATTTEKSVILTITEEALMEYLLTNRDFTKNFIQRLTMRLHRSNKQIEELITLSHETRILRSLYKFWRKSGARDASGEEMVVELDPFIEYVEENQGYTGDVTRRALQNLKKNGTINIKKSRSEIIYLTFTRKIIQLMENQA